MNFTLEGKITEKSAGKLTVSSGENMIFHVLYNDKTEIKKKDGSPGTAQDLHIGVRISVAGDLAESGEITAKKIEIEGEGSENKSTGQNPRALINFQFFSFSLLQRLLVDKAGDGHVPQGDSV